MDIKTALHNGRVLAMSKNIIDSNDCFKRKKKMKKLMSIKFKAFGIKLIKFQLHSRFVDDPELNALSFIKEKGLA